MQNDHLTHSFFRSSNAPTPPHIEPFKDQIPVTPETEISGHEMASRRTTVCGMMQAEVQDQAQFQKIYQMMTNKRAPSATVKARPRPRKDQSGPKSRQAKFLSQFEQFFEGFIEANRGNKQDLRTTNRHKKTKKMTLFTQTTETQALESHAPPEECEDEEEVFVRQMQKKLTYHRRMKQKITKKIEDLHQEAEDRRLRQIEMIDREKDPSVQKVLWLKAQCCKIPPKLRIIRSGLSVRLSELDPREKNGGQVMMETQKARKDHIFQRGLQKSCQVVLSEIQKYQVERPSKKSKLKRTKPGKPHYLNQTNSTTNKLKRRCNNRRSLAQEELQQWRGKCGDIEKDIHRSRRESRWLSGGLKVFEGYCRFVETKLSRQKEVLNLVLQPNNNMEIRPQRLLAIPSNQVAE